MMRGLKAVAVALCVAVLTGSGATAQTLRDSNGPAETPSADFTGRQYVDSKGCVFVRAGYAGQVTWVPRVDRDRNVVCGYEPTLAGKAAEPVAEPAPEVAEAAPAPAEPPEPDAKSAEAQAALGAAMAKPAVTTRKVTKRRSSAKTVRAPVVPPVTLIAVAEQPGGDPACPNASPVAQRYVLSDGRQFVRCGPAVKDPVRMLNALNRPDLKVLSQATNGRIAANYQPAWTDGRLNPVRGKGTATGQASMDRVWTRTVPAVSLAKPAGATVAPRMAASGGRYVQIGAFAVPQNADGAAARLRQQGMPVSVGSGAQRGRPLKLVLAGPFSSDADLHAALRWARASGFPDAFVR
jgi:cell division septation protein DedD